MTPPLLMQPETGSCELALVLQVKASLDGSLDTIRAMCEVVTNLRCLTAVDMPAQSVFLYSCETLMRRLAIISSALALFAFGTARSPRACW
jgi:hypothetical protein